MDSLSDNAIGLLEFVAESEPEDLTLDALLHWQIRPRIGVELVASAPSPAALALQCAPSPLFVRIEATDRDALLVVGAVLVTGILLGVGLAAYLGAKTATAAALGAMAAA